MGFGKGNTGVIIRSHQTVALGTLAAVTAIKLGSDISITEDFRMLKSEVLGFIEGLTAGEGTGLMLGIANGELSVAEIVECLLADGPDDRNDRLKQEKAERYVKIVAQYEGGKADTAGVLVGENADRKLTVKPRWTFSNPEGWDWFIFNAGGSALTTGATAKLITTDYGLWLS